MTPEQQKEYDDYIEMFSTNGWKTYAKGLKATREATLQAAPSSAIDNNTWQYCRGLLQQMDATINFETYVEAVAEANAETDDEDEGYDPNV